MSFDAFKRTFFAHLHHTFNIGGNDLGTTFNSEEQAVTVDDQESLKDKRRKLETYMKEKFTKSWISVRKAFLDLDNDHDGYITHEDIIRYFRTEKEFPYLDIKKLI